MEIAVWKKLIWPVAGIAFGALARTNPFYAPQIPLNIGVTAWLVDVVLVLICSFHPCAVRVGVLVAGLFLAVPCLLRPLPMFRFLLMCGMGSTFALAVLQLFPTPAAGFRGRLAYIFTWLNTREVKRRERRFDAASVLHLIGATLVLAAAFASVKGVSPSGIWWLARWLAGGIMFLAFAEMTTAGHDFLTAVMGIEAPALMRSPHRSASLGEFWSERWNPAVSTLVFGRCFFAPLARRGVGLALFAAFFASAVAHGLLLGMATRRWGISLMWGAFFLVQPLLIAVERRMKVRRWQPMAGRAWTLAGLGIASPLFVEPALQLMEPTWGPPDNVLLPTVQVLGFVMLLNGLVSLGSLASIPDLSPPNGDGWLSPERQG